MPAFARHKALFIGVAAGLCAATAMIWADKTFVAEGDILDTLSEGWHETLAGAETLEWSDVFGVLPGTNAGALEQSADQRKVEGMYRVVHNRLLLLPEEKALQELADKWGMTKEEAAAIKNGSLQTATKNLLNRPGSLSTSHQDAAAAVQVFKNDFNNLKNLYDVQQEVEVSVAPSEIFSNGDLADSGFDLVHDLSVIETILFTTDTDGSVGAKYDSALSQPYVPQERSGGAGSPDGNSGTSDRTSRGTTDSESSGADDVGLGTKSDTSGPETSRISDPLITYNNKKANITLGENTVEAEILDSDICEVPGDMESLNEALNSFEEAIEEAGGSANTEGGANISDPKGEEGSGSSGGDGDSPGQEEIDEVLTVSAVAPDEWGAPFCPALNEDNPGGDILGTEYLSNIGGNFGGAAASYQGSGLQVNASVCIDVQMISGNVSSSGGLNSQDKECVQCEVEKINSLFRETVASTLTPNKVTGNIFEPAKCKASIELPLIDLKTIVVLSPVLTPPNDDLIFKQNMVEEWNQFVDRLGWAQLNAEEKFIEEFEVAYAPQDSTTAQIYQSIQNSLAANINDVSVNISSGEAAIEAANSIVYTQTALQEIRQMRAFFENFRDTYSRIATGPCVEISNKPRF